MAKSIFRRGQLKSEAAFRNNVDVSAAEVLCLPIYAGRYDRFIYSMRNNIYDNYQRQLKFTSGLIAICNLNFENSLETVSLKIHSANRGVLESPSVINDLRSARGNGYRRYEMQNIYIYQKQFIMACQPGRFKAVISFSKSVSASI